MYGIKIHETTIGHNGWNGLSVLQNGSCLGIKALAGSHSEWAGHIPSPQEYTGQETHKFLLSSVWYWDTIFQEAC